MFLKGYENGINMYVGDHWIPRFPQHFHFEGDTYVACSHDGKVGDVFIITAINSDGRKVNIPSDLIDENKPKTIRIGTVDVPEPLRTAPEHGESYWVVDIGSAETPAFSENWTADEMEFAWLNNGLLHKSFDAAIAHAYALLSLSKARK